MSIYRGILSILNADGSFPTAIGTDSDSNIKVYPIFPTRQVATPFVAMKIDNQLGNPTKDAVSAVDQISFSFRVYGDNLDTIISISDALITAIDKTAKGTYDTVPIGSIDFESYRDDFIYFEGQNTPLLYRELTFEIWA